ncbi:hypothetical protein C8K44_101349 [Aminobacter sp. AP02]|nr:hypothetical protein C8K44_101349 [Aminobacter sp. AP02]
MRSDFATARRHLEQACKYLPGDDDLTRKLLAALYLLIDATLTAEHIVDKESKIVAFPGARPRR